jgi:hypothetical protein
VFLVPAPAARIFLTMTTPSTTMILIRAGAKKMAQGPVGRPRVDGP